jgi:hypothetical protein
MEEEVDENEVGENEEDDSNDIEDVEEAEEEKLNFDDKVNDNIFNCNKDEKNSRKSNSIYDSVLPIKPLLVDIETMLFSSGNFYKYFKSTKNSSKFNSVDSEEEEKDERMKRDWFGKKNNCRNKKFGIKEKKEKRKDYWRNNSNLTTKNKKNQKKKRK